MYKYLLFSNLKYLNYSTGDYHYYISLNIKLNVLIYVIHFYGNQFKCMIFLTYGNNFK
jgi:hypothetical protein